MAGRPDDALPAWAIGVGVLASATAVVMALIIDGWRFRGRDFTINILASIALLGPGLLFTNVLARNWRHQREHRRWYAIAGFPVARFCDDLQFLLLDPLTDQMRSLRAGLSAFERTTGPRPADPDGALLWALGRSHDLARCIDALLDRDELTDAPSDGRATQVGWVSGALHDLVGRLSSHLVTGAASYRLEQLDQELDQRGAARSWQAEVVSGRSPVSLREELRLSYIVAIATTDVLLALLAGRDQAAVR